jgi:hypothetical protein
MDQAGVAALLWGGLEAVLAFGLAFALLRLATAAYAMAAPRDAEAVPLLHVLALAAGATLGVALLLALPHGGDFRPSRLFIADGPWAIGLGDFLGRFALPRGATLRGALDALGGGGFGAIAGWLALALLAAGPLGALRWWRGAARWRAIAAFLLLAACTALLLHYGAHLLAWAAALLNFWLLALALLAWQGWRHAPSKPRH